MTSTHHTEQNHIHISSPDELHDYMKVTNPGLWVLLSLIVLILIGFIVYASTTVMESTVPLDVYVENIAVDEKGNHLISVTAVLSETLKDRFTPGMEVRFAGDKGKGKISMVLEDGGEQTIGIAMDDPTMAFPDGVYEAEIITEKTTPIHFLIN